MFSVKVSLVVPAISVTIALSVLESRFKIEDFPALGFPIMTVFIPSLIMLPSLAVGLSAVIAVPAYIFMLHYRNQQYKKGLFN